MMPEIGNGLLCLALGIALLLSVYPLWGVARGDARMMASSRLFAWLLFMSVAGAFLVLVNAFVVNDFTVTYVASNSNTQLPVWYRVAATWGAHEGSLLLWVLLMSGWTFAVAIFSQRIPLDIVARVLAIMGMVSVGFLLFILFTSNPFSRTLPNFPIEGRDLNPLLQDPGLIFHPPLLYMGYVGFSVAFAFAIASLLCGRLDSTYARFTRPWTLAAWIFLTLGIVLGSAWAYCELGWGGWWFWDPVENASLLPWLSATALLHSLSLTRQREIFRHWSLLLAIVTLMLSLLGTLIVRSGILVSVHAFALDNVRAVPLFSLFALISLASLALYGWRARDGGPVVRFSGLSREMLILATLLLFCAVLLIVLVGTLYPMIYGLLGWGRLSVGAPYFNRATLPFGLLMLVVIVLATFVSGKRVQLPALVAHAGVLLFAAGIVVSSVSRQEISLNLQPGQQVTLAGYTFRFERLDLQAKGNYTSEKAIVALFDHQQRIGELMPERRFYEARRQQMMEPSIRWNGIHDWYAVMGEKTGADRYAFRLYVQSGVRWIWGGGLLMIAGALLSGWRGRKRDE
ncbi:heme lyase CcmF/NrfE family subunit [Escherichia coli]|nr:heme lyase CcmF/NrfE family subunit [Escherichia coli]TJB47217.1 heme lyase CcmF/NrfE family subunit [Escherichia coli]